MSAVMFPNPEKSSSIKDISRIPQLQRSASLRVKSVNIGIGISKVSNPCENSEGNRSNDLRRTASFMERGEKRYAGAQSNGVGPIRPQHLNTTKQYTRSALGSPQLPARLRSLSLSLSNAKLNSPRSPSANTLPNLSPKTPPTSPNTNHSHLDWETDSITSLTSITSVNSACDHASIARNGTTFSGRSKKYVFHCNQYSNQIGDEYLTPTQRVHRQVKKLKFLLEQAKKDLEDKDSDILKLTKEVVELRIYKAALNSPEDKSNSSSDAITVKEITNIDENDLKNQLISNEMNSSYSDSGHFEDFTNSSIHSKDSIQEDFDKSPFKQKPTADKAIDVQLETTTDYTKLIIEYEKRLQELVKTHEEESYQLKQKHNDKVEELLQRITDINTRYWQLVPELDLAKEKIKELEIQLEEACSKLVQQDEKYKQNYLDMFNQGQEAARVEHERRMSEISLQSMTRISVPELLEELQVTKNELENVKDLEYASTSNNLQPLLSAKEALSLWVLGARKAMYRQLMEAKNKNKIDPEITLQFLKSAIYYFLTDKENSHGHLRAIESILGFTPNEISNIEKARLT